MLSILVNSENKEMETEIQPMLEPNRNNIIVNFNDNKINNIPDYIQGSTKRCDENSFEIFWKNLSFSTNESIYKTVNKIPYKIVKNDRKIIKNLCGRFTSGRLTAILGPNGAGKSTLLECLSGRRKSGLTGEIYVTYKVAKRDFKFSYYSQKDILLDTLTVEESLFYSSQMKFNQKVKRINDLFQAKGNTFVSVPNKLHSDKHFHRFKVEKLINELHLQKCSKTPVSQCSGGQKRRLSIALELIFSPSILLLDEPTSGLDSLSTLQCIQLLKGISQNPDKSMVIAVVIHQPTAKLLSYFDDLYVMSSTGQCIYEGPTSQMVDKLSEFSLNCPQFHNPSDFVIEISSGDYGMEAIELLVENHNNSYEDYIVDKNSIEMTKIIEKTQRHSLKDQILTIWPLTKRCLLINLKDPKQYLLQFSSVIIMLFFIYVLHLENKIGINDACIEKPSFEFFGKLHIFDILNPVYSPYPNWAFIFYSMLFVVFVSMLPTLLSFPLELSILTKEHSNGWYSVSSYFLAKNIADIPPNFIFPIIYCIGSYIMTEQIMEFWRLLSFISILILLSFLAQGFGFLVSAIFVDNVTASTVIGAIANIPLLLFAGLLIKIQTIPLIFQPLTYLSYFRLTFESMLIVIYGFGRCEPIEKVTIKTLKQEFGDHIIPMGKCIYDYDPEIINNVTLIIDWFNDFIEKSNSFSLNIFEFHESHIIFNILVLILYSIILRVLSYILLVWKTKVK